MELNYEVNIPTANEQYVKNNEYLNWAFYNIMAVFTENNPNCVIQRILLIEKYWKVVYSILKPKLCIFWNPFVAFNKVAESVARSKNIPVLYVESGNIPGTICYETWGGMGESRPAKESEYFRSLPVFDNELKHSKKTLEYLYSSGLNRNIQNKSRNSWISNIQREKPIVLYAGQNDSECGIVPYNEYAKQYQSPIFSSSYSSMIYLAELAQKNGWNFIYKPHPIVARRELEKGYIPTNVIYVTDSDINEIIDMSDVVITITSTTSYIALIREKPVVMLGYIQLRGQGCTYEAFTKEVIESKIKNALEFGFTYEQKQAFIEHTARMNKYYLFDNGQQRDICYGQPITKAVEFIEKAIDGKAEF